LNVLDKILQNRKNKDKNIFNAIPYSFSKLSNYFPIFSKGTYAGITANPSVGKTQLWKSLVFSAIENCIQYNIDAKFLVILLEESLHEFECSLISYILLFI
jgi:replicative DNA helicase